jgi:hypothetical protein
METGICQGLVAFLLYLGATPLLLRLRPASEPAAVVLAAAAAFWLLSLAALLAAGQRVNFWAFSITYGFLALCFLMAFGAIYKSISLRVVAHLFGLPAHAAPGHALERQVLEASYQERLEIIAEKRYAHRAGESYTLSPSGSRIAARARRLQSAFRIMRSG